MRIFSSKDARGLAAAVAVAFLFAFAVCFLGAGAAAQQYKKDLLAHDYALAGYLAEYYPGVSVSVFTAEKTEAQTKAGKALLQSAGMTGSVAVFLLPGAKAFQGKAAAALLLFTALLCAAIVCALLWYLRRQEGKIDTAIHDLRRFLSGSRQTRLDDRGEGSLFRLFGAVNEMATSLTAHAEKEKQGREFLKETISDISHQLKTPLAALKMYADIILGENTGNEAVERFTRRSQGELSRMESLIQNLLKLAKLDADAMELDLQPCSVPDLLQRVTGSFLARCEAEEKELTVSCPEQARLHCDEVWLAEAVSNVVKNALDHTGPGGRIAVSCTESPVLLEIAVADNGSGIHPEDLPFIFRRFYRSRFSKDQAGVGIGLTLTKRIVEKHGGTVTVESTLGRGTTFRLAFPLLTKL